MAKSGPQRYPGASTKYFWQSKWGGDPMESNVVVWHSAECLVLPGYGNGGSAPNFTAVPDFAKKKLTWFQHFDFDVSSRALRNNEGGVETNTLNVVQVELVGTCDPEQHAKWKVAKEAHLYTAALPAWAIRDLAAFARWAAVHHKVPLTAAKTWKPYDASFGAGNGVRMSAAQWTSFMGHCGHMHVPENTHGDPGAFPMASIIALAKRPAAGPVTPSKPVTPARPPAKVYIVRSGDSLSQIARRHGIGLAALLAANPRYKPNPNSVAVGAKLFIPSK
jgi:LysM repeat protein